METKIYQYLNDQLNNSLVVISRLKKVLEIIDKQAEKDDDFLDDEYYAELTTVQEISAQYSKLCELLYQADKDFGVRKSLYQSSRIEERLRFTLGTYTTDQRTWLTTKISNGREYPVKYFRRFHIRSYSMEKLLDEKIPEKDIIYPTEEFPWETEFENPDDYDFPDEYYEELEELAERGPYNPHDERI